MKPRVLFIGESSYLHTGYAIYTKQVLSRLHASNKFDIMEFGIYGSNRDERCKNIPWKFVGNLPDNEEQERIYNSTPFHQFGEWRFEEVALLHKPHVVINISDFWQHSYISRSPLKEYFNWLWLATVDGTPQNSEWLSVYSECDALFTYSDWGKQILEENGLSVLNTASPAADDVFVPKDSRLLKQSLGLQDFNIIGTVMRNQKRKLYPDLFATFAKLLKKYPNTILYCHTSYPDNGFNIPQLLLEHNLCSKVLFTYICNNCQNVFPSYYLDILTICPNCKQKATTIASSQKGISDDVMANIFNLFDLYVQYTVSEGFGIPVVEAAACGVPVLATDYSATSDTVRKVNGYPIDVYKLTLEQETGRYMAVPDNNHLYKLMDEFLDLPISLKARKRIEARKGFENNYSWDHTAEKYSKYIESIDINSIEEKWHSPPKIHEPDRQLPQCNNSQFAKWLILNVLKKPSYINSYMHLRLLRDLDVGFTYGGIGGFYFNEHSHVCEKQMKQKFGREEAYNHFVSLRNRENHWENRRCQ